ncbi:hypothetical protein [Paraburkholderia sp. JHI869]|uniref:hypothetical protein n=1 Tax=Paraburkholderia sp. JHI869 TaxID=3112959 RepID=UPI003181F055
MQIHSHTEQRRYMRHLCIMAVAVVCVTAGVLRILQSDPEPAVASSASEARPAAAAFGPAGSSGSAPRVGRADPRLAVTENHELIVNAALLDLLNSYLLEKTDDRAEQLRAYLKSELPSPAYGEAVRIVEHYQAYMKAHDEFLAAQHLAAGATDASAVDIERVAVWSQQRDRLRRSFLGDAVVQAWYQNDDAQLDQVLQEWRQRAEDDRAPVLSAQQPRYPVPHWRNENDEERHRQYMLRVLDHAMTSFETLSRDLMLRRRALVSE